MNGGGGLITVCTSFGMILSLNMGCGGNFTMWSLLTVGRATVDRRGRVLAAMHGVLDVILANRCFSASFLNILCYRSKDLDGGMSCFGFLLGHFLEHY